MKSDDGSQSRGYRVSQATRLRLKSEHLGTGCDLPFDYRLYVKHSITA
jgi:hypothetical protein